MHSDAFAVEYSDSEPVEPRLVTALRAGEAWIPDCPLVAVRDEQVVGHVCYTRAAPGEDHFPGLGLGPLGVVAKHKKSGVGSALMRAVIGAADALYEPLNVLLGHPGYYPRFGFRPAAELGIRPESAEWAPAFQARTHTAHRLQTTGVLAQPVSFHDVTSF